MTRFPGRRTAASVVAALVAAALVASITTSGPATARDLERPTVEADAWGWPVGPPARIMEPFRAPPTPYASGHRGIDLASAPGARVVAPAAGVVSFAGSVAGRPVVAVDHGGGYVSAIEPVAALLPEGAPVEAGQPIGEVASGGHCDGRCVHFGVRLHGEYVSPLLLLGRLPRAVLLPLE